MKQSIKAAIAAVALLVSGLANAEVLHDGKVHQTTADKLIQRDALPCAYGDWKLETLPNGTVVLTRAKRCEASRGK